MNSGTNSELLFQEALHYFPGGVNSPVRAFKSVNGNPIFIKQGKECYIYDEDDQKYIDFCCSWGPLILGHCNKMVTDQIVETLHKGTSFGTPTRLSNRIAKLILENHKYIDKIRFVSSGTEAVMSALRLARAYTKKSKIIKFEGCYHGHADAMLVKAGSGLVTLGTGSSAGIPSAYAAETLVLQLNDPKQLIEELEKFKDELAAVIIEPIPANNGLLLQTSEFLKLIRTETKKHGILLIFDEVISGFRIGFEGASDYYGIQADIYTYGKIIGGGLPVGAIGGKAEIMNLFAPAGPVYQAGTLSANPLAMTAGWATLIQLLKQDYYIDLKHKTESFLTKIKTHIRNHNYNCQIISIGSMFWLAFSRDTIRAAHEIDPQSMEYFKKLHSYLLENGVYFGPSGYEVCFVSSAHSSEALDQAANVICSGLDFVFK